MTIPRAALFDDTPPARERTAPDHGDADRDDAPAPNAALPVRTFLPQDEAAYVASRRADGWSAANQRLFLEAIAEGHGVDAACTRVGLSAASAYAFRRTAKGAAFALGWRAAGLVARDAIAETLLVRALEGQVDTYVRADGTTVTRHRHDNRLAMSLLARLDRQVETSPDVDVKAARLVAQEFDAFLDMMAKDGGPARAGLFIARRAGALTGDDAGDPTHDLAPIYALAAADRMARTGVATAGEVDVADLDPARRAEWTAEQWARAEAAGLIALAAPAEEIPPPSQHSQHSARRADWPYQSASSDEPGRPSAEADGPTARLGRDAPDEPADEPVWWDEEAEEWRTTFPPPAGFTGYAEGRVGHMDYQRCLTEAEEDHMGPGPDRYSAEELHAMARERNAFFAPDAGSAKDDRVAPADDDEDEGADPDDAADADPSYARSLVASRVVALRPADSQLAGIRPI